MDSTKKNDEPVSLAPPASSVRINSELLRGLRISLEARLGEAKMTVEQLMALKQGSVVTLEASLADRVELFLNDALVARGEIVAVGDKFGVRIVEISQKP